MGVSTTHRINLSESMWILIYSFSDTYYVWAACEVSLIHEQHCFIGFKIIFSLLSISGKACFNGVDSNDTFLYVGISIRKNITYEIIMQENQISQLFRNLPVCERYYNHVLTEENMASCSRAFQKPKNAEDERKLIENSTPKSTSVVKKYSLKKYFMAEW